MVPHLGLESGHLLEDLALLPSLGHLRPHTFQDYSLVDVLVRRVCRHPTVERRGSVFNNTLSNEQI